jgi:hypothetical protein
VSLTESEHPGPSTISTLCTVELVSRQVLSDVIRVKVWSVSRALQSTFSKKAMEHWLMARRRGS